MESRTLPRKQHSVADIALNQVSQPCINGNECDINQTIKNNKITNKRYSCGFTEKGINRNKDMDRIALFDANVIFQGKGDNTMGFTSQGGTRIAKVYEESGIAGKERYNSDKLIQSRDKMKVHSMSDDAANPTQHGSVNRNVRNADDDMELRSKNKILSNGDICHKAIINKDDMELHPLPDGKETPYVQPSDSSNVCNIEDEPKFNPIETKCYTCDICRITISRKGDLDRHYLTHTGEKPYKCDFCHKSYVRITILKRHMLRHIGEPSNSCNKCGKEFMLVSHLERHMITHTDPRPHKCPSCGKGFQTPTGVSKHMSVHTGKKTYVQCDICDKKLCGIANLFRHKRVHLKQEIKKQKNDADNDGSAVLNDSEKGNKTGCDVGSNNTSNILDKLPKLPFACKICDKAYTHRSYLKRHMVVHSINNPLTCKICQKQFVYQAHLTEHLLIHSSKGRYNCKICNREFDAACNLRYHMNTHTAENVYKCKICFKEYTIEGSLRSHMEWKHGERRLKCEICGEEAVNESSLKSHLISHSNDRPFKCEMCPKTFKRKGCLAAHMKRHSGVKPYNCNVCNAPFVTQSNLSNHMQTHDDSRKTYDCTICTKSYLYKWSLEEHMYVHTDTKPYVCDLCGMAFRQFSSLRRHKMRHSGTMPYKCETCGKAFRYKPHYREHQYVHTGEPMPFPCEVTGCNKTFFTKSKLDKHVSTHLGLQLYKCNFCDKKFRHKNYFRYHVQKHLGEDMDIYACDTCGKRFSRPFILKQHIKTHLR